MKSIRSPWTIPPPARPAGRARTRPSSGRTSPCGAPSRWRHRPCRSCGCWARGRRICTTEAQRYGGGKTEPSCSATTPRYHAREHGTADAHGWTPMGSICGSTFFADSSGASKWSCTMTRCSDGGNAAMHLKPAPRDRSLGPAAPAGASVSHEGTKTRRFRSRPADGRRPNRPPSAGLRALVASCVTSSGRRTIAQGHLDGAAPARSTRVVTSDVLSVGRLRVSVSPCRICPRPLRLNMIRAWLPCVR